MYYLYSSVALRGVALRHQERRKLFYCCSRELTTQARASLFELCWTSSEPLSGVIKLVR